MPNPPPPSILILGLGELGTQVLHHLLTHPSSPKTNITILLRPSPTNKTKLPTLCPPHTFSLLSADLSTIPQADLTTLLAPFHTIIGCTGMSLPRGTQLKLTRAVLAASASTGGKVRHYIPWQFGLDYDVIGRASAQDLFDEQLDVRGLLREHSAQQGEGGGEGRGVKWTIMSTGMFMRFLFEEAFGVVELKGEGKERVTALGSWENELTVTEVEDIGRVVAELVLGSGLDGEGEGEGESSGVVYVAGDTVSMSRLADVVEGVLGREVERRVKSVQQLEAELREEPDGVMRKYRAVFAAGVGVSWEKERSFNARRGIETVLVEDWARRNLKVPVA
uniref:NmrA-like domain-containing protein n=1 Tax=Solanum lycopersicum TaxID=4081 RepID=A0A494G9Q4_SOLLC